MGLSRSDWSALTPKQYSAFREAWHRRNYENEKASWERTRWSVFRTMCPPDKKKITITDLIKFPWEEATPDKKESKEESKKRFDELKELWQ